jgi:DNA-binding NarL/FixJ family response regulator
MATKLNVQIDGVVREMTDEEFADFQELQASQELAETERLAKETARSSALAKLAALGLTEEEIAAL